VGTEDIWTIETATGRARRLTFDDASDTEPVWSPDGARVLFASNRRGKFDLFWTLSDGSGKDELLQALPGALQLYPRDWTVDGQLAYEASTPSLVFFPMSGLQSAGARSSLIVGAVPHAKISPDRRWIAYASHESGVDEVYVRAFPLTAQGKWQISVRGGIAPAWRMDGTELFYLGSDQTIMAVSVNAGRSFEASRPKALFRIQPTGVPGRPLDGFAVSRNGLRFLVNQPTSDIATPITVVVNWTKSLRH
jgi:Tol biopolymer transport system component